MHVLHSSCIHTAWLDWLSWSAAWSSQRSSFCCIPPPGNLASLWTSHVYFLRFIRLFCTKPWRSFERTRRKMALEIPCNPVHLKCLIKSYLCNGHLFFSILYGFMHQNSICAGTSMVPKTSILSLAGCVNIWGRLTHLQVELRRKSEGCGWQQRHVNVCRRKPALLHSVHEPQRWLLFWERDSIPLRGFRWFLS